MTEAEDRDHLAMTLDILVAVTAIALHNEAMRTPPETLVQRLEHRDVDQGWLEFWRRNAVA